MMSDMGSNPAGAGDGPASPLAHTRIHTRAKFGIEVPPVTIEAHQPGGAAGFSVVGMAQTAVREARDRVKSAIKTLRLDFPKGQLVVSLAPADLAKHGGRYDLAIAMSVVAATGQVPARHLERLEFIGEFSLSGEVRGCFGAALAVAGARRGLVFPVANARELAGLLDAPLFRVSTLAEAVQFARVAALAPRPLAVRHRVAAPVRACPCMT